MTLALAEVARKLVAHEGGEGRSPEQVAASVARSWKQLSQHLSRLVGDGGVRALFDRSLTLTAARFPWLVAAEEAPPADHPWTQLLSCLEKQEPDVALEASVALVTTFLELLGRFIGEELAMRLLHEVWPEMTPATPKEST